MRCREFRNQTADEAERAAHVSSCPECMRQLQDERHADAAIGLLRKASAAEQAPPDLEPRLIAELRVRRQIRGRGRTAPRFTWRWTAAAAAAVVLAGIMAVRFGTTPPRQPAVIIPAAPVPAVPVAAERIAESTATRQSAQDIVLPSPASSARREVPEAVSVHTRPAVRPRPRMAVGTEFFPTMRLAGDEPATELQLVRVRVSRRTLEGFGLSLDPRVADRPVKADLLIGPDGLTRAVRFISERE